MLREETTLENLNILTKMNILLREAEKIDNEMTDAEVEARMRGFIEGRQYRIFTINNSEQIVGYAAVDIQRQPPYLRQLFVYDEFRSKGIGRQVLAEIKNDIGATHLDVEVMAWNAGAVRFYESLGAKLRTQGYRI